MMEPTGLALWSVRNRLSTIENCISPFELGGLGDFTCNLMFDDEGLDASMNLSLYRPEKSCQEDTPDWEWFLYSELDGEVETLSQAFPVSNVSGAEIIQQFVSMISDFLQLDEVQSYIREYCKEKLAA